jgi:hypothetical protein
MGKLATRLSRIRRASNRSISPKLLAQMRRATEELRASQRSVNRLSEGDEAPDFALRNTRGRIVRLAQLSTRSPVVLSFFRGHW